MYPFIPELSYEAPPFPEYSVVEEIVVSFEAITPSLSTNKKKSLTKRLAALFALVSLLFFTISYGPSLFYVLRGSTRVSELLNTTANGQALPSVKNNAYQPAFDRNLTESNTLSIPVIGVKTQILEATNEYYETALTEGVWRVNDFGTPYNRELPTILAAHRYGYLNWSIDFRLHHSFFNLPKLAVGDTVDIVWRQRKYTYAVYKEETATEISDYSADLILYTCEDLSSDVRIIKYARLIEM